MMYEISSRASQLPSADNASRDASHTSGFRDFFGLIDLSGRDALDFDSPAEILKLIVRQRGLNNTPGDEFIYSNTNYFLLGVVVQRATKNHSPFSLPKRYFSH